MSQLPLFWNHGSRPAVTFASWRPLRRQLDEFLAATGVDDGAPAATFAPRLDLEETADQYVLTFDVPGIAKEQIDIEVKDSQLTITGERPGLGSTAQSNTRFVERPHGKFRRSITLPEGVNATQIQATHSNGVLTVTVAKAAAPKPVKIAINGAAINPHISE